MAPKNSGIGTFGAKPYFTQLTTIRALIMLNAQTRIISV
jgi:hypothetical protein